MSMECAWSVFLKDGDSTGCPTRKGCGPDVLQRGYRFGIQAKNIELISRSKSDSGTGSFRLFWITSPSLKASRPRGFNCSPGRLVVVGKQSTLFEHNASFSSASYHGGCAADLAHRPLG